MKPPSLAQSQRTDTEKPFWYTYLFGVYYFKIFLGVIYDALQWVCTNLHMFGEVVANLRNATRS